MQKWISMAKRHPYFLLLGLFILSRLIILAGLMASYQRDMVSACRWIFCWLFNFPLTSGDTHALFVTASRPWQEVAAYWDGQWYLDIISHGYTFNGSSLHQNIAHYPFFPWLCQGLSPLLERFGVPSATAVLLSGLFISNSLFLIALWLFYRLGKHHLPALALPAACLLALYPGSVSTAMFLSESTYMAFSLLFFVLLESNRPWLGAWAGGAAALTRVNGLLLPITYIQNFGLRSLLKPGYGLPFLLLLLCLLVYPALLATKFGDPCLYFKLHAAFRPQLPLKKILLAGLVFGACWGWGWALLRHPTSQFRLNRLACVLRWGMTALVGLYLLYSFLALQGMIPRQLPGSFATLPEEQFLLLIMLTVLALVGRHYHQIPQPYRLYTLFSIYPILASGTFLSAHRYLLAVFPMFWILAATVQAARQARIWLFILFPVLLFGMTVLYSATGWLFLF